MPQQRRGNRSRDSRSRGRRGRNFRDRNFRVRGWVHVKAAIYAAAAPW